MATMDLLDYLPFIQFIRDDKETVEIMKEALEIVPRVCSILDNGLPPHRPPTSRRRTTQQPSTSAAATRGGNGSRSLKRSSNKKTDGAIGTKTSGPAVATALNSGASCSSSVVLPPKKRKLSTPNQNQMKTETQTRENQSQPQHGMGRETEETVQKLQEDYDTFIRQVGDLAALEREKNKLLEKFLAVSSALTGSDNPATASNDNGLE